VDQERGQQRALHRDRRPEETGVPRALGQSVALASRDSADERADSRGQPLVAEDDGRGAGRPGQGFEVVLEEEDDLAEADEQGSGEECGRVAEGERGHAGGQRGEAEPQGTGIRHVGYPARQKRLGHHQEHGVEGEDQTVELRRGPGHGVHREVVLEEHEDVHAQDGDREGQDRQSGEQLLAVAGRMLGIDVFPFRMLVGGFDGQQRVARGDGREQYGDRGEETRRGAEYERGGGDRTQRDTGVEGGAARRQQQRALLVRDAVHQVRLVGGQIERGAAGDEEECGDGRGGMGEPRHEAGEARRTDQQGEQHGALESDALGDHRPHDTAGELYERRDGEHHADGAEPHPQPLVQQYRHEGQHREAAQRDEERSGQQEVLRAAETGQPGESVQPGSCGEPCRVGPQSAGRLGRWRHSSPSSATTARTLPAALSARCSASSAVAASASTIPVQLR